MAELAVKSAANLLGKILVEEGKYLWGAEGKVEELRDELLWMQSFLKEADTVQYKDETVGMWVCQIKEYVYEAEDIIEDFVIKVASNRSRIGMLNKLKRYSCIFRELYDLHQAASSIDSLKVKISSLSPKLEKYGLKRSLGTNTGQAPEALNEQVQQILKFVHIDDKKIVGLEKNAEEIITALTSTTADRRFHAIYGMGGLGKTTLATKVFQNDRIKQYFTGGQAFVYISKQFQVEGVLQDILKSLDSGTSNDLSRSKMVSELHEVLKNRKCLVVLDDVWTKQAWDSLKAGFTSCGGDAGSKVLLTTRKEEVAMFVDPMALQKPDPLNNHETWELLQKTMGWDTKESSSREMVENNDVCQKIKLGKEMVSVCKGLPLAIVVLGGVLRNKQTLAEWKSVQENISSHLLTGYDHGRSCMEILVQSYNDLPYHLKSCFLHLANFPEDHKIHTEPLYWMWVAEGLVTRSSDRTTDTKSLEDVADDYLSHLAQVGLVEIVDKTSEGLINSIRMHDLVRDMCLEKATIDNFLNVLDLRACPDQQFDASNNYSRQRLLRMAIHLPAEDVNDSILDYLSSKAHKYLRSLLFIADRYSGGDDAQKWITCICNEFQLVRVLVLDNIRLRGRLTSQVERLKHLRYLSLARTSVSELPSSIGSLKFLEILDLGVLGVLVIPNTLWKLFRLRHLLFPYCGYEIGKSERLRVDTLICLEKIENLLVKKLRTKDLLKLKRMRELSIKDELSEEAIFDVISSPALKSRRRGNCSLRIKGNAISKKPGILSDIVCNHQLSIHGQISVPVSEVEFSQYLEKLYLEDCQLEDDPMSILGSLGYLKSLTLAYCSYVGKEMSCRSESFPLLTEFETSGLNNLEVWDLEDGSMPMLELLTMSGCSKFIRIPDVLPSSLNSFYVSFSKRGGRDANNLEDGVLTVDLCDLRNWLENAVLNGEHEKVVLLGGDSVDKATIAMELYDNINVNRHFDAIARVSFPRGYSVDGLPRCILQQLLRDLNPKLSRDQSLSRMSCDNLIVEIQQVMQSKKCLVILINLEEVGRLEEDLDKTFGREGFERGSKVVITLGSDQEPAPSTQSNQLLVIRLCPPTRLQTWQMRYWNTNSAGIKWNMLRHWSGHPLSAEMLEGLLKTKDNIVVWATKLEKLCDSNPLELSEIFDLCYNDLPLHLKPLLIYLANFPEEFEISTKKLYKMWIAAGFVGLKQDNVQTEESLENLASSYLTELVQRGMVTVVKRGPSKREKTCQLKFALQDMCLKKAKEEQVITIVDQFEHTSSTSNAKLKVAAHLNQISLTPASLDKQLSSLRSVGSPTSLLFFPNVSDPAYSEQKWDWFIYICKCFQLLQVLDLEGMWLAKGRLPKEVGKLRKLRYLSLRGTWVNELPPSIENLKNLQTLDLRVLEYITIPDVLWKLNCLMYLYLPEFIAPETPKLRLRGLNSLQTLINLNTDKVCLVDLLELKLLREISVKKIHAVDELDGILKPLSKSVDLCFDSEIINADPTILASFRNLHKVKIKGTILVELCPEMFPVQLEEVTLKHTRLLEDPLAVLERLPKLKSIVFEHESFLGKAMTFSESFFDRAILTLCSLSSLEKLYLPYSSWEIPADRVVIVDCYRLTTEMLLTSNSRDIAGEELYLECPVFSGSPPRKRTAFNPFKREKLPNSSNFPMPVRPPPPDRPRRS